MSANLDLVGRTFGHLTVVTKTSTRAASSEASAFLWECSCECGGTKLTTAFKLRNGLVTSCGCSRPASSAIKDLTGVVFGRLTVVSMTDARYGKPGKQNVVWRCRCECGATALVSSKHLRGGGVRSCGCLDIERRRTHGLSGSPTYNTWSSMRDRCENHNNHAYRLYGGRGIRVCERWSTFENFLGDMGETPGRGYSIDRIDSNGNYEPGNCRWATAQQQGRNTRSVKLNVVAVCLIKHMSKRGARGVDLAWAFGVSPSTINLLIKDRTWTGALAEVSP